MTRELIGLRRVNPRTTPARRGACNHVSDPPTYFDDATSQCSPFCCVFTVNTNDAFWGINAMQPAKGVITVVGAPALDAGKSACDTIGNPENYVHFATLSEPVQRDVHVNRGNQPNQAIETPTFPALSSYPPVLLGQ